MSSRSWLKSWLLADPEQDTLYAAIDQQLMRQEPWRLDVRDGLFDSCGARHPAGWTCSHHDYVDGMHMARDGYGELMASWQAQGAHRE